MSGARGNNMAKLARHPLKHIRFQ